MKSKTAYTPKELVDILIAHEALIGEFEQINQGLIEGRDAMYDAGKGEKFDHYRGHTLKHRLDAAANEFRSRYEANVPKNVRDLLESANILPDFKFSV